MQTIFSYIDRDTFVHRLHPVTKLGHVLLTLIIILIPYGPTLESALALSVWLAFSAVLWGIAGISLRQFWSLFKILLATFVFLILIQGFMYRGGEPLLVLGHLPISGGADLGVVTDAGLLFGLLLCVRVLVAVSALPLFISTTTISRVMAALNSMGVPNRFTFMFVSSLSFTNLIFEMWNSIIEAQKLRAFDIESMPLWQRARRAYVPVIVPLILLLFRKGNDLEVALKSRAFGSTHRPTQVEVLEVTWRDHLMVAVMLGVFGLCLWIRLFWK